MIRQVIDAAPRPADARATGKGSGAMDKREILISLFAAAAFTALLAHGFKTVRAEMPAGALPGTHAAASTCALDAVAWLPCPTEPPTR
jgi:hypothetical protein